jgi:serine/threonine-protein kinase
VAELPSLEGFRIIEELGSGAVTNVYKAVDEPTGRTVALKMLKPAIASASPLARPLDREARVLATLSHGNIGLLYAFVKNDARTYLVLEYVDGFSLAALLKKTPTIAPDSVAAIGAAVAHGLAHAHDRGVVHRDVKPANILVSRRGDVKLFDFGIAQQGPGAVEAPDAPAVWGSPRVETPVAFGTPAYMSPEQILGETVDARSDIFSLGVVLYQLVCGARPFERGEEGDRRASAHRIRRDPPVPLHRRAPDVPPALERIVMRAIEKLPADRFQTAAAMAEQLDEAVRARSGLHPERLVARALEEGGLAGPAPASEGKRPESKQASVRRAVAGLAVLGGIALGGGGLLQATARREGTAAGARPLELVPATPGYLRVLATPWAEVWIDGQKVAVTPFARGIPLPPGKHYVTLYHPSAPVEKRTAVVVAGETRTIDVVMNVSELAPREDAAAPGAAARAADVTSAPPRRGQSLDAGTRPSSPKDKD